MPATLSAKKIIIVGTIISVVLVIGSVLLFAQMLPASDDTIFSLTVQGSLCVTQPCPTVTTTYTVYSSGLVVIAGEKNTSYYLRKNQLAEVISKLRQLLNTNCSPQTDEHFSTSFTINLGGQTKTDSAGGCTNEINTLLKNLAVE